MPYKTGLLALTAVGALLITPVYAQGANQDNQAGQQSSKGGASLASDPTVVKQAQQALDKEGFKAGKADGKFGPATQKAVRDFQKSKGLQANGQLDEQTLSALGIQSSATGASGGGAAGGSKSSGENGGASNSSSSGESGGASSSGGSSSMGGSSSSDAGSSYSSPGTTTTGSSGGGTSGGGNSSSDNSNTGAGSSGR